MHWLKGPCRCRFPLLQGPGAPPSPGIHLLASFGDRRAPANLWF